MNKNLLVGLRCGASLGWLAAGVAKIAMPAPAEVAGLPISSGAIAAFGVLEVGLAVAWWVPALQNSVTIVSLVAASAFAACMILGVLTPETCSCFGKLQVSRNRHLLVLGILIVTSAMISIYDERAKSTAYAE